jgi:hypothetical protein
MTVVFQNAEAFAKLAKASAQATIIEIFARSSSGAGISIIEDV